MERYSYTVSARRWAKTTGAQQVDGVEPEGENVVIDSESVEFDAESADDAELMARHYAVQRWQGARTKVNGRPFHECGWWGHGVEAE